MVSSCCTSTQTISASWGEHLPWIHRHFAPRQWPCQSFTFWYVTDYRHWLRLPFKTCACTDFSCGHKHECMHLQLYMSMGKWWGGDSTSIFSPVHWVLHPCYAALFLWEAVVLSWAAERSGIAPALLPDPGPPAPTSVGETYMLPGRQWGEAICKKKRRFLDGCRVHPPPSHSVD